jgi:hypothetical protein
MMIEVNINDYGGTCAVFYPYYDNMLHGFDDLHVFHTSSCDLIALDGLFWSYSIEHGYCTALFHPI